MKKKRDPQSMKVVTLNDSEMHDAGTGVIDVVVHYVALGLAYFYNMGISEAKRMRAQV